MAFRPGGGDSFSGGGGGGGGGGDGGILDIIEFIIWFIQLCFDAPWFALALVIGFIGLCVYIKYKDRQNKDWDSGPPVEVKRAIELRQVREKDRAFSQVVFEDFAYRLFSTAHRARSSEDTLATVAPYVSANARKALADRDPRGVPVEQVIVGAMRVFEVQIGERATVSIEFEANVLTKSKTYYSVERWRFSRDAAVASKPPGATKNFPCPNCGAPWQAVNTGTQKCASCGQVVDNGRFDWIVDDISLASMDERPPTLTTETTERGTDLATVRQRGVDDRARSIQLDLPPLEARLQLVYSDLNTAWTNGELAPVRGLVSDGLFDYLQYWVDAYKREGLRNELSDMRITRTELAKVTIDRFYHAVTIRLWGTGKDFVVQPDTGKLVRGSKRRDRAYSEYWTLIRSAEREGPAKAEKKCGNCGAPLDVTMAGACQHCGAHVTAGEFDWVLSKIEQDDSYRG